MELALIRAGLSAQTIYLIAMQLHGCGKAGAQPQRQGVDLQLPNMLQSLS